MERDKRDDEKWKKKKRKSSLCVRKKKKKGSTGWMSHRPQSVNEPADPCNKLLGRTAELEICRHSQNKKNKKKKREREREREGGRGTEGGRQKKE